MHDTARPRSFAAAGAHQGESAFRLYSAGVDGLLLRLELVQAAHSSLDLQYFIFHGDESGKLIAEALGNTEIGLIIHSGKLAEQTARRFDHMVQPVTLYREPARSSWQKFEVHFLTLFPIDREL